MYPTRFKGFEKVHIYTPFYVKQRERLSNQYYGQFEIGKSLVFTYLNTDNPLNNERETYVLVGMCKLKEIGHTQRWSFKEKESYDKWGDLVWSRRITQSYSPKGEGLRIPYQEVLEYQEKNAEAGDLISPILFEVDNDKEIVRKFKYVSRDLTDIEAASIIEQLIPIVRKLKEYQTKYGICKEIDWDAKEKWLSEVLSVTYKERSRYPGIVAILDCLHFQNAMVFFNEFLKPKEKEGVDIRRYVLDMLEKDLSPVGYEKSAQQARKYWKNSYSSPEERDIMMNVLSLIDLRPTITFETEEGVETIATNQVEKILDEQRSEKAGIRSSVTDLIGNPYLICEEYQGEEPDDFITFDRIDAAFFPNENYYELDHKDRMDRNDPRRVRAKIIQILKSRQNNGDCFLNVKEILEILEGSDDLTQRINVTLRDLRAEKEFYKKKLYWKPVGEDVYLYLQEVHQMEQLIESKIRELIEKEKHPSPKVDFVRYLKRPNDKKFPVGLLKKVWTEKSTALENSYVNRFSIITGVAGSGKTSGVLDALVKIIHKVEAASLDNDFLLLAPTGKAAIRLSEIGMRAFTIDYVLTKNGWVSSSLEGVYLDNGQPLNFKNIIIDESSMIDLEKMSILFKAINWEGVERLILAGDVNQLPPIGLGKPFFDIIWYLKNANQYKNGGFVNYLNVNCRRILEESEAAKLAAAFASSEQEDPFWEESVLKILGHYKHGDLEVDYWEDEMDLPPLIYRKIDEISKEEFKDHDSLKDYDRFNRLVGAEREDLNEKYNADNRYSVDFFQIISPYKQDFFGTVDLNYRIQHKYHSALWSHIPGIRAARCGRVGDFTQFDKVIQTKNRYRQWFEYDFKQRQRDVVIDFLANGQLGTTRVFKSDYDKKRYLLLEYRGEEERLLKADARFASENLELAYVLTVHKVQGSQFNVVMIVIPEKAILLSKELIYTALTRPLDKLVMLIQNSAKYHLLRAKNTSSILNRNSSIFFHYDVRTPSGTMRKQLVDNHIHRTNRLDKIELVISKSEVVIANMLLATKIQYEYERILDCPDFPVMPDFTFFSHKGEPILYWEHLGMSGDDKYDEKWERKRQGYIDHGYRFVTKEELGKIKDHKSILTTKESKGAIDSTEIQLVIDGIKKLVQRS
jgi:ATP-dependent exoDNAse (exonuclease V) alpha subunit